MDKEKMSRRDFLKTAGAGAAAAGMAGMAGKDFLGRLLPPGVQAAKKPPPPPGIPIDSAVIIGAGLGGLVTASLLTDKGKTVTVIENCHRPGGRVQNSWFPNGQWTVAAGSEWYDSDTEFIWLVKDYLGFPNNQIATMSPNTFFWWKNQYCYCSGGWGSGCVTDCLPLADPEKYWDYETESKKFYDCILVEPSDAEGSCYLGTKKEPWDVNNYYDYMVAKYDETMADHWGNVCFPAEGGVPPTEYSEAYGHFCMAYWYWDNAYHLKQGNYAIIEALMSRIPAGSVKLNEKVSSVTNTPTGVQVVSDKGTYTADVAIVSVPWDKVEGIVPELSTARATVLDKMLDAHCIKANLQFSERFWLDLGMHGWGGYADFPEGGAICVTDETENQTGTEGILGCYINEPQSLGLWETPQGSHVRGAGADRIADAVLAKLDEFWPATQYYNGNVQVFEWASDNSTPYGPVMYTGIVRNGDYATLRDPIDKIHFAASYVYDFGLTSATHRAMDVADLFE